MNIAIEGVSQGIKIPVRVSCKHVMEELITYAYCIKCGVEFDKYIYDDLERIYDDSNI